MPSLIVLDPTAEPVARANTPGPAPRPRSLAGLTLGVIMNRLADCELMFDALYDELKAAQPLAGLVKVMKDSQSVPPNPAQWAEITGACDVVVTGFGGCGSCSTRSMRDALDLEAMGIPAVCVGHTALEPAMRAVTELGGMPGYPIVTVGYPHPPIATWDKDEARAIARQIAGAVRRHLTDPAGEGA